MIIAKRNYERMILKEIGEIPDNALPHILKLLKLLKKSFLALEHPEKTESESTGLCGIWQDERTAEEIIEDIYSGRTGLIAEFNRQVSEESSRHKKIQALKGKYAHVKTDSEAFAFRKQEDLYLEEAVVL